MEVQADEAEGTAARGALVRPADGVIFAADHRPGDGFGGGQEAQVVIPFVADREILPASADRMRSVGDAYRARLDLVAGEAAFLRVEMSAERLEPGVAGGGFGGARAPVEGDEADAAVDERLGLGGVGGGKEDVAAELVVQHHRRDTVEGVRVGGPAAGDDCLEVAVLFEPLRDQLAVREVGMRAIAVIRRLADEQHLDRRGEGLGKGEQGEPEQDDGAVHRAGSVGESRWSFEDRVWAQGRGARLGAPTLARGRRRASIDA